MLSASSLSYIKRGQMDTKSVSYLINSISRFIHLVSSCALRTMPTLKDYRCIAISLKLLKPILDNVVECKVPSDEIPFKECEELDIAVNEAREFMENWCPKMSKICGVLQSDPLVLNIQGSSFKFCHILSRLLESSPSTSSSAEVEHCLQEFHCLKLELVSGDIEEALKSQREGLIPHSEHLTKIIESLSLTSSQELLQERIALEKERMNAKVNKMKGELDKINHIIDLISHIGDYVVNLERYKAINGVQIPPYFRCPLSLELMLDPVIVATGQTYERASVQKWLDHGLTICPGSRQMLSHTNLIPNFTVKALIENWCEVNNIKLSNTTKCTNIITVSSKSEDESPQVLSRMANFHPSLPSSNSTSRSSLEVQNGLEKQKVDASPGFREEETNVCRSRDHEKLDHSSPEQSYIHSRSESASSAISSIDYFPTVSADVSRIPCKHENVRELSGEMTSDCPTSSPLSNNVGYLPWSSGKQYHSSKTMAEVATNGSRNYPRMLSLPTDSGSNDLTTTSHVEKLVKDLKSISNEVQTTAAAELRFCAKNNMENRNIIGQCGAIAPLISLLHSDAKQTQEHAVTALLNLSINANIKAMIAEAGAVEPLMHVLKTGNAVAKENAAAALFSLSVLEQYRVKIGRSGAVKPLVDLLGSGTLRGKKDAATALFNLSIFHENKARIVQAGAVNYLVQLMEPATEMVDKAVALLANLSTITEGCMAIAREGGIPLVVEVVETGSQRGKENAASILLHLCISSPKYCRLVLQEGAVPPLVALSQAGTPRAKEKAQQLLSHFRNQREGAVGRGKS